MVCAVLVFAMASCGGTQDADVDDLQLVGIDFQLSSVILTNNGTGDVRTDNLWLYQDGRSSRFNVFIIEPRATILFSARDVGGIDVDGGEIALFRSDSFSDPDAMLDYVAWGSSGHSRSGIATDAGLWSGSESVDTGQDSLVMLRIDPTGSGPSTWEVSSELP